MAKLDQFEHKTMGPGLGPKINVLLNLLDLTQAKVSEESDVSRSNLNRFLRGQTNIRSDSFVKLLATLGVNVNELLSLKLKEALGEKTSQRQIGQDIENIFLHLDPLVAKTLIDTIVSRSKKFKSKGLIEAVANLTEFRATLR